MTVHEGVSASRHQLTARALVPISCLGFAVGAALVAPALDPETSREALVHDQTRVVVGPLGEFVNAAAVVLLVAVNVIPDLTTSRRHCSPSSSAR